MNGTKPNRLERTERYLLTLIQREGADRGHAWPVNLLLGTLKACSRLYLTAVQFRLFLYHQGILRRFPLGCQVISVGNLTVGGTGKTPVVEVFARELQKAGRKVAILSRGYRKKELSFGRKVANRLLLREQRVPPRIVSDGGHVLLDSEMSGDEPYMLASNLPGVVVLVDKDRVKSGRYAVKHYRCDTLILDDGFQYQKLRHRLEVVLVDRTNPFGNGNVLPRGILREPFRHIRRADFIFLTKSDGSDSSALRARIRELNAEAEITECRHEPRYLRDVHSQAQHDLSALRGMRVVVLSGIAAPAGFERSLEEMGATILKRIRFADHHRYSQQEVLDIVNAADQSGADAILTTEKDAVRLPRIERCPVPVYFLRVDIEILAGAENFHQCVEHICFQRPLSGPKVSEEVAQELQDAAAQVATG